MIFFDPVSALLTKLRKSLAKEMTVNSSKIAQVSASVGSYVSYNGRVYKVISAITSGVTDLTNPSTYLSNYSDGALSELSTAISQKADNTDFTGTDGTVAGSHGLVPSPAATDEGYFLCADGDWKVPPAAKTIVKTVGPLTPNSSNALDQNIPVSGVLGEMKATKIEVSDSSVFLDTVYVTCGDGTINVTCAKMSGTCKSMIITMVMTSNSADVTSAEFDILAGRINEVNDQIANKANAIPNAHQTTYGTDLNDYTVTGLYGIEGATNCPAGESGYQYGTLIVNSYWTPTYITQIWQTVLSNKVWIRIKNNGTWSAWNELQGVLTNINQTISTDVGSGSVICTRYGNTVMLSIATSNSGTGSVVLATLPSNYRPSSDLTAVLSNNNKAKPCSIRANGQITGYNIEATDIFGLITYII